MQCTRDPLLGLEVVWEFQELQELQNNFKRRKRVAKSKDEKHSIVMPSCIHFVLKLISGKPAQGTLNPTLLPPADAAVSRA